MVNRLANFAHHQFLNSHLFKLQNDLFDAEIAVASEKKTQKYAGLASQSQRLVNLEYLARQSEQFNLNNNAMDLRLETQDIAMVGIEETISNIKDMLSDFSSGERRDENQVEQMQKFAYQALRDIQGFLNEKVGGRYLFSGSRIETSPVSLGLGNDLNDFQTTWNGDTTTYPTTRSANIMEFGVNETGVTYTLGNSVINGEQVQHGVMTVADSSLYQTGSSITLTGTNAGTWTVLDKDQDGANTLRLARKELNTNASSPATDTYTFTVKRGTKEETFNADVVVDPVTGYITPSNPTDFQGVTIPSTIEITSADGNNNLHVTATAFNEDTLGSLTIEQKPLTAVGGAGEAVTVSSQNYYNGDLMTSNHRIDDNRVITLDTNGLDPAFEKAIRALSIIAQGKLGTTGGLDQNTDRADDALWLLNSSLNFPTDGTPPYGTEETSSIEQLRFNNAFQRNQIKDSITREEKTIGFLEVNIGSIENIDMLEATTRLLDIDRALQASYQVLSRTQKLGLANFL
ncbi:hypothetical protein GCM10011332_07280 [Terasakiella brassicae]|uniref:Flagellar hook-associated protein 3 n=1 Tax=Terasakiella brassicae TaxID=1634917 RepID=A0A917BT10_9PROT|nr:flagellin [Terasakiella brassicae]GGF56339.1 hypothetical protein GCM10011332_07280 [Terasakiella brassicae]